MKDRLLAMLVRMWTLERPIEEGSAEIVVAISYCTGRKSLMKATHANLRNAIEFCQQNLHTYLCVSRGCSYPFKGAAEQEWIFKARIIKKAFGHIPATVVGDPMINTVDEACWIRGELSRRGLRNSVRHILICTGPAHSRSAYYIYKKLFPGATVYLKLCSFDDETQLDHSVQSQRSPWVWFVSNVARHIALRLLPLSLVRKIKRRPANEE